MFCICLKICVLSLLREMNRLLHVVLCEKSPYHLINDLGYFSVTLEPSNFYKVEFTYLWCWYDSDQRENLQKYFNVSAFKWNLNH